MVKFPQNKISPASKTLANRRDIAGRSGEVVIPHKFQLHRGFQSQSSFAPVFQIARLMVRIALERFLSD